MSTTLLQLAPELHLLIGECLSQADLSSLIQAHRRLWHVLTPQLYRRAVQADSGRAALESAVRKGNTLGADLLLATPGASAIVRENETGKTALHVAAGYGQAEAAALLLQRGANANAVGKFGCTPLHLAAVPGSIDLKLLKFGADRILRDSGGARAIGANVDGPEDYYDGKLAVVKVLLTAGADVDAKLWYRGGFMTPLVLAARWGHRDMVELLLQAGADERCVLEKANLASRDTRAMMIDVVQSVAVDTAGSCRNLRQIETGSEIANFVGVSTGAAHVRCS